MPPWRGQLAVVRTEKSEEAGSPARGAGLSLSCSALLPVFLPIEYAPMVFLPFASELRCRAINEGIFDFYFALYCCLGNPEMLSFVDGGSTIFLGYSISSNSRGGHVKRPPLSLHF